MTTKMKTIAERLRDFRRKRAWSQNTLAVYLRIYGVMGASGAAVSRWENEERMPQAVNLYVLDQAFAAIEAAEKDGTLVEVPGAAGLPRR